MTVKELKEELNFYDDDTDIVFEINDDVEIESTTTDKWGYTTVHLDSKLKPSFMGECLGDMRIELEAVKE